MSRLSVLVVCGTRPEAIKLAPLILQLKSNTEIEVYLCASGQHKEMLSQVFDLFGLVPDYDLAVMSKGQTLAGVTSAILNELGAVLNKLKPDRVIVHGDTNTTMSASLAALYAQIPVSHVEAGLRTGDIYSPWPEEANRRITGVLADRHYAPTIAAKENLLAENVDEKSILVTGNTVIDALLIISEKLDNDEHVKNTILDDLPSLNSEKRLLLVTGHRRENFGQGFESFFGALKELATRDDVQIVFPVHLNPNVQEPVKRILAGCGNIFLTKPLEYLQFVYLMKQAYLIISDSGGIQEEAPALGVPVLVTRDNTERPEAVESGTALLVGTKTGNIVTEAERLLDNEQDYKKMSTAKNPFGDGTACLKIVEDLLRDK